MASIFLRRNQWWIKLRHPGTGELVRESLQTHDHARAKILCEHLEHRAALLDPRFQAIPIPQNLADALKVSSVGSGLANIQVETTPLPLATAAPSMPQAVQIGFELLPPARPLTASRTRFDEALACYLRYIASDNAAPHVANKISMLRRFVGTERLEKAGGTVRQKRKLLPDGKTPVPDPEPFFKGEYLDEINPVLLQSFIEGLGVKRPTMRHYREMFHHLFSVCLKLDLYHPTHWHRPNPITALPSYLTRNRRIVFLKEAEVEQQLDILKPHPNFHMAVAIMIHAGLRRAEALWLTKESIAKDLTYLSVLNRSDEEEGEESSLKTGERTVTILPALRPMLSEYLDKLKGKWVVPNAKGNRWRGDCFGSKLKDINEKHGLNWTSLTYRHTYATQRAAEGWSLHRISREMGNSPAVVDQYYAGYIRPDGSPSEHQNSSSNQS